MQLFANSGGPSVSASPSDVRKGPALLSEQKLISGCALGRAQPFRINSRERKGKPIRTSDGIAEAKFAVAVSYSERCSGAKDD